MISKPNNKTALILLLNAFFFTISAGINITSFPLILYNNGVSSTLIGIANAVEILAGVLIAKFLYSLSRKVGKVRFILILAALHAFLILILPFYVNILWWIFLIFISGICWFSIITLRQAWLNYVISNQNRSIVLAIFSTMLCAGFAVGPLIVKIIGAGQYPIFIISAVITIISCFSLWLIRDNQPVLTEEKIDYKRIIKEHKSSFIARFLMDLQVGTVILFTVIYGIKNGLSAEDSGILLSVFMLIGLLDFAIGVFLKNRDLNKYINIGFFGALISMVFLPKLITNYPLAILIYMIYGWFMSLIFISLTTKVNHNQNKNNLIAINSVFQAVGAAGALFGSLLVGLFLDIFGNHGFIITIILANLLYIFLRFYEKN
jgi:MFS family permease